MPVFLFLQEDARYGIVANWNKDSEKMVEDTVTQTRFEALRAQRNANLDHRRQKLASKLAAEDEMYAQEMVASKETPEQKRARLAVRARELAAVRENERQQLASQLLDRHFRENCDPLREKLSKQTSDRAAEERYMQIQEHREDKVKEVREKLLWHEVNELERLKKEQR